MIKNYFLNGFRFGLEVDVPTDVSSEVMFHKGSCRGRCDFVAINRQNHVTCIEIKISKSDFKSWNGHNLIGHKNYYAIPDDLYPKIKDLIPEHVGVYTYSQATSELKCVKCAKHVREPYISKYGQIERLRKDMLTATNSTIRRIYSRLIKESEAIENATM